MENKVNSTQSNIKIAGIKDGIVFLQDGGYRIILQCSTVNFALKSEQEQNALIFQYQSFLNSLHFPIQIVMQSKKLDLTPYLKKIKDLEEKQTNELIKMQTIDYIDFVSNLINVANIMKKNFYVVIPYQPISLSKGTFIDKIFKKPATGPLRIADSELKTHKDELTQRASTTASGLGSMGIQCIQLNTEEIIELFYKMYNPEISGKERLEDAGKLTSSFIADEKEKPADEKAKKEIEEEKVIDNTAVVQEKQKQDTEFSKIVEMKKNAEKPVAAAPTSAPAPAAAPVTEQPPTEQPPEGQTPSV